MGDPVVVRAEVREGLPYHEYQSQLRYDFWYSCAYCSMTEIEATCIAFQIDHFYPQKLGGGDEYRNLMWSCSLCNNAKRAHWPSEEALEKGARFMRPDEDDPNDHIRLDDKYSVRVVHKTEVGKYTINMLMLNRKVFRLIREHRLKFFESDEAIANGLARLTSSRRGMDHLKPDVRPQFLRAIEAAQAQAEKINGTLIDDGKLREINRSPLLDRDPDDDHTKARREYLKEINAKCPDPQDAIK